MVFHEVFFGNLVGDDTRKLFDELRRYRGFKTQLEIFLAGGDPRFAFIKFEDPRFADVIVHDLNGRNGWLVEHHDGSRCYFCSKSGHIARNCPPETGTRDPNHNRSRSCNHRRNRSHMNHHRARHN